MFERLYEYLHEPVHMDVLQLVLSLVIVFSFASGGGMFFAAFMIGRATDEARAAAKRRPS